MVQKKKDGVSTQQQATRFTGSGVWFVRGSTAGAPESAWSPRQDDDRDEPTPYDSAGHSDNRGE